MITSSQNVIFQTSKNSNLEKQGLALGSLEELAQDGRGERRLATLFLRLDRGRKVISSQTGLLDTSTDELQEIDIQTPLWGASSAVRSARVRSEVRMIQVGLCREALLKGDTIQEIALFYRRSKDLGDSQASLAYDAD